LNKFSDNFEFYVIILIFWIHIYIQKIRIFRIGDYLIFSVIYWIVKKENRGGVTRRGSCFLLYSFF